MINLLKDKSRILLMLSDLILICCSYLLAYYLRLNFTLPREYFVSIAYSLPMLVVIRMAAFYYYELYKGVWRYASVNDLLRVIRAVTVSGLLIIILIGFLFRFQGYPRSAFVIDWFIAIVFLGGSRFAYRLFREIYPFGETEGKRVLIFGAGDAGETILREIKNNPRIQLNPVGFIDDDPRKRGLRIRDIPVLGTSDELEKIAVEKAIEEIVIAIPSATGKQMRRIIRKCRDGGVKFKTIPGIGDLINGKVGVSEIREVNEADLLRREVVEIDSERVTAEIAQRSIMVTGAGGSIGSELCRQICQIGPRKLILFDKTENSL